MITRDEYQKYYMNFASAMNELTCFHCRKDFHMGQEYYTISVRIDAKTQAEVYFHKQCFENIATTAYIFAYDVEKPKNVKK